VVPSGRAGGARHCIWWISRLGYLLIPVAVLSLLVAAGARSQPSPRTPDLGVDVRPLQPSPEAPPISSDQRSLPESVVPSGADETLVTLRDLLFDGNSVYDGDELAAPFQPLIGTEVLVSQIYAIATVVQERYRRDGYLLARAVVPPQRVEDGRFRIRIVEGFVEDVLVEGDPGGAQKQIQLYVDPLRQRRPVQRADLERSLLLVNDLPGVSARGVLRPARDEPGATELVLRAEQDRFSGTVVANDRGSRFAGPQRVMLISEANSLLSRADRLELLLLSALESDEQRFVQLAYDNWVGDSGLKVGAHASYGPSRPGSSLSALDIESVSKRGGVWIERPLVRGRSRSDFLEAGFEAIETRVDTLGKPFSHDDLRVLYVGFNHVSAGTRGTNWQLGGQVRQGLDALGASENDAMLSRLAGTVDFTSIRLRGSVDRPLPGPLAFSLTGIGQYAFDTLLADEEIRVGGERFGRGYDPAELSGDSGLGISSELQHNRVTGSRWVPAYQLYAFYDAGKVWNDDTGSTLSESLASAGFGVRARIYGRLDAALELAKPLTRDVIAEGNRDARVYVQVSAQF
jgi:hemolysin activation/secretion protein